MAESLESLDFVEENFHLRNQTSKFAAGGCMYQDLSIFKPLAGRCYISAKWLGMLVPLGGFIRCNIFFKATGHQHLMK